MAQRQVARIVPSTLVPGALYCRPDSIWRSPAVFVPLRRSKAGTRDAAKGRADPTVAYGAWLQERLIDMMPFATLDETRISAITHRRVLRKVAHGREHTRIREELIPVVDADVLLTVGEPAPY